MSKSRKKKQQLQGTKPTVKHDPSYKAVVSVYNPGPRPARDIKNVLLEAMIDSATHLGKFDAKTANRVRNGRQTTLFISVPLLANYVEQFILEYLEYHAQPHRTPTDGAAATMANDRSEEVPAIPEPLYGLKKQCSCDKSFWKLKNYRAHYAHDHIVMGIQPL